MNRPIPEVSELVSLRRMFGISQETVALDMDSSQTVVSRLETGRIDPRWSTVQRYRAAVTSEIERLRTGVMTAA